jgi:hypothetical protein
MEQLPQIQGGPRPLQPAIPEMHGPEDFTTPMEKIVYGTLGDPVTPDYIRDVNDQEKKRREILKEAKRVKKMGKKLDGDITQAKTCSSAQGTWRRNMLLSSSSRWKKAVTCSWHGT